MSVGDEADIVSYNLEKSSDGVHFQSVATVTSNPQWKGHYTFEDPAGQQNLYRLKLISKNNHAGYSNIITLQNAINEGLVSVMPNPAKEVVNITSATAEKAVITLFDMTGRKMKSITTQSNQTKMDLSGLPNGQYIVNYKSAGITKSIQIEKQ